MTCLTLVATLVWFVVIFNFTGSSLVVPGAPEETIPNQRESDGLTPPCCKVYVPPQPFRKIPRPNRFREAKCKEGNNSYQVGDTWNHDPECVEHECTEDGTIVIHRCPPIPDSIPEGWKLKPEAERFNAFYPFCCKRPVPPPDPKKPVCYYGNRTVKVGEQVDIPGRCYYHVCTRSGEWSIGECGNLGSWHAWEILPGDLSKSYPDCCGRSVPVLDIVPGVLDDLQSSEYLAITYGNISVEYGNELTPSQVRDPPDVSGTPLFGKDSDSRRYLLIMTDPDASDKKDSDSREFLHWMVGNFPKSDITSGEVIAEYVGAAPPKRTGLHRYVFLMFEQPDKLDFDEIHLNDSTVGWRANYSTRKFAEKYKLGQPLGFNVFRAQWDDYVPEVLKRFGI